MRSVACRSGRIRVPSFTPSWKPYLPADARAMRDVPTRAAAWAQLVRQQGLGAVGAGRQATVADLIGAALPFPPSARPFLPAG